MLQWVATVVFCGLCIQPATAATKNVKIALKGRPVSQSSTGWGGVAGRAIDGNRDGHFSAPGGYSCTHTDGGGDTWWRVDLDQAYRLDRVVIYNRVDDCTDCRERIDGATVYVYDGHSDTECGTVSYQSGQDVYTVQCNGVEGNKIEIRQTGILTLCEVEAFGEPTLAGVYQIDTGGLTASQSSTDWESGGVASRAIDGNTDQNWNGKSCSKTGNDFEHKWTMSLGQTWLIDRIVIYNRKDCCSKDIDAVMVHIWNGSRFEQCGNIGYNGGSSQIYTVYCRDFDKNVRNGDKIDIRRWGDLTLCEVEIYGKIDTEFGRFAPPPAEGYSLFDDIF